VTERLQRVGIVRENSEIVCGKSLPLISRSGGEMLPDRNGAIYLFIFDFNRTVAGNHAKPFPPEIPTNFV
jgi:hypothetical protein